jgi:hypothetical protein
MLFIVIEFPARAPFNPFKEQIDLFTVFNQVNEINRRQRASYVSYHMNAFQAQEQVDLFARQMRRFLVLEMLLENRLQIPQRREPFSAAVNRANFHFGEFEVPINSIRSPSRTKTEEPKTPFAHIPIPDSALQERAKKAVAQLGEDLPGECTDPITMEPLSDPIEINHRVYNRSTLSNMLENGMFKDPFTRERIDPTTAKSAAYMLEAMEQHLQAKEGKGPALLKSHKNTDVQPLKDLIELWEKLISEFTSSMAPQA